MEIGPKIRALRLQRGLTQEELADRTDLTKGFISQVEHDYTSPSISTLIDILEALGTNISSFFSGVKDTVVYKEEDMFEKELENGGCIRWLVTKAQGDLLEPILMTLPAGAESDPDDPHEGEEFGYMLQGSVTLMIGEQKHRLSKGDSFSFRPTAIHHIINTGKKEARILWVSTPPSF